MIPNGWRCQRLEDVAEIQTGLAIGGKQINDPVELPYLRVANVQDGFLDLKEIKTVAVERSKVNRYILQKGDVLLTEGGDFDKLGRGTIWSGQIPCCLHQNHIFVVRTDPHNLLPQFFSLLASSSYGKKYFLSCAKQTTNLASINSSQLKSFPVLIPPLPEQREIVQVLTAWDGAINLTEQLIAAKQKRKQMLMQRLLTGQVRFSIFRQIKECSASRFGLIPEEWKVVELGSVVSPINRPTSVEPEQQYRLIGVRWYGEGAHIHDIVNGSKIQTSTLTQIREGDILYNKMWTTKGAFAIAKAEHDGAYGSTEYPQFVAQQDRLDIHFLEFIFHLPRFKRDAINLCRGTTGRARLNPQDFLKLEIPLPPLEEQKKIADLLNGCQEEINLLQQKLAALRQQKKGLMQQLLTGKIRVKV